MDESDPEMERGTSPCDERPRKHGPHGHYRGDEPPVDDAIITTDVGQHQMFVTQYVQLNEKKQLVTSGGLGPWDTVFRQLSARRSAIRTRRLSPFPETAAADEHTGVCHSGSEELPLILCVFNNEYLAWCASGRSFSTANATV